MQCRSRERRSNQRARKLRSYSYACIAIVLLSSCATTQPKKYHLKSSKDLKKVSEKICVSGQGRGKITVKKNVNRFTYESSAQEGFFWLGIDIPFKGQETLALPMSSKAKPKGTLYEKITEGLVKSRRLKSLQVLNEFMQRGGKLLEELDNIKNDRCQGDNCLSFSAKGVDQEVTFTDKLPYGASLLVTFSKERSGFFTSMKMSAKSIKSDMPLLEIHLINTQCE